MNTSDRADGKHCLISLLSWYLHLDVYERPCAFAYRIARLSANIQLCMILMPCNGPLSGMLDTCWGTMRRFHISVDAQTAIVSKICCIGSSQPIGRIFPVEGSRRVRIRGGRSLRLRSVMHRAAFCAIGFTALYNRLVSCSCRTLT